MPWHDEMSRDGAVVKVPATEGLCSHELTITLANVLEVDPVQFSINVPLGERPSLSDEPSAVVVKGLKLVPAPEEEEEDAQAQLGPTIPK